MTHGTLRLVKGPPTRSLRLRVYSIVRCPALRVQHERTRSEHHRNSLHFPTTRAVAHSSATFRKFSTLAFPTIYGFAPAELSESGGGMRDCAGGGEMKRI